MPGMATNPSIFERISLPENVFEIHWLEWMIPEKDESLNHYAGRMARKIKHDRVVLLGVSFGGILVQEMSKYLNPIKLIIVSSVKSRHELPQRMKIASKTKAYKLVPTRLLKNVEALAKYVFGETSLNRIELYKRYLSVNDKDYLDWAIEQLVNWDCEEPLPGVIHIHGDKDMIFPVYNIKDCILVKGGSHIMILNRFKWFNDHLPKIILT
jgi:hypothetical protein